MIVVHAEVMPHGRRHIEPSPGIESVTRLSRVPEDKTEIVLATRSDILPLGETRPTSQHDLDPAILQKRTPGNTRGFTTRRYTKRRVVLMVADASSDWQSNGHIIEDGVVGPGH
jgi:hypothetical protein